MNKTVWKIFIQFTVLSAIIAVILLLVNFFGLGYLWTDTGDISASAYSQSTVCRRISENISVTGQGIECKDTDVIPEKQWCIIIDENGDIIWEYKKPEDIPDHYTMNDIARMSRWYLNDYPVYVWAEDYGLLVVGLPKKSVGKYELQFSMDWFDTLPRRALKILGINLLLAALLACVLGMKLYQRLKMLTIGIQDLRQEKRLRLREKGIFKELARNINETAWSIERKNAALRSRDDARSNWIAGISHDIRTPLSMVMGYSEAIANAPEISEENREKAKKITAQSIKMKKLIEDFNLISSLEYDMQPSRKKPIRLCSLLRNIVTEILNNGLPETYEIRLDFTYEKAEVMGDESLLERAFFNLINNAVLHNSEGCIMDISQGKDGNMVWIRISDNGSGVPEDVLNNLNVIPKTAHGLGLPMAYRIFYVHGGKMKAENRNGFAVTIELPVK